MAAPAFREVACTYAAEEETKETCTAETELPDCGDDELAVEFMAVILSELWDGEDDLRGLDSGAGWRMRQGLTEDARPSYPHMIQVNNAYEPMISISGIRRQ